MDAIRLVAITEPVAVTGSATGAGPASVERARVATTPGIRHGPGQEIADGAASSPTAGMDVLDHLMASRLGRVGAGVRWGIGAGGDEASATRHAAIALLGARERGAGLGFATGDPWRDALLADLGLALAALLDDLTPRQAQIASLVLVDRTRQAQVAEALGVSRATVSVAVARGRLPAIAGARRAIESLLAGPPGPRSGQRAAGAPAARPR